MSTTLPKPPRVAFVYLDSGLLTRDGDAYIRGLFERAGGRLALTNIELADLIAQLGASETVMQPASADPLYPDITQPASADAAFADVMQAPQADQSFAEVMQSFCADALDETTFQT